MSTFTLAPSPWLIFLDDDGAIVPDGQLAIYEAGTSTPATVYKTSSGTAHTFPITLDGAGRIPMALYLNPGDSYKFVLHLPMSVVDLDGAIVKTQDNVSAVPISAANQDVPGVLGETLIAGLPVYLSDGSGGQTAGRWYQTNATLTYASLLPEVGFTTTGGTAGQTDIIRLGGIITVTGPLSTGANYYLSDTPGVITTSASTPTYARLVGQAASTTTLVVSPNPNHASVLGRTVRILAATPYTLTLPTADGIAAQSIQTNGAGALAFASRAFVCQGRLTLTTAVPVPTTDVNGATTLYFTPFTGNRLSLPSGTAAGWYEVPFTEVSIALSGLTASRPYDVFVFYNMGTPTLQLQTWTNSTTRSVALALQDGIFVKTGDTAQLYLGTIYINASGGQSDDAFAKRFVWNQYNRVPRPLRVLEATDSWTYTTATIRQANGSAANQVEMVTGATGPMISVALVAAAQNTTGAFSAGIGENSTSSYAPGATSVFVGAATSRFPLVARLDTFPALGYSYYAWNEYSQATGTTTWYGDNGTPTFSQSGLTAMWSA